jgi:hypothetical protein
MEYRIGPALDLPRAPGGGAGEGAGEHESERTLRYVSERADPATLARVVHAVRRVDRHAQS